MESLDMDSSYLLWFDPGPWRWELTPLARNAGVDAPPFDPHREAPEEPQEYSDWP